VHLKQETIASGSRIEDMGASVAIFGEWALVGADDEDVDGNVDQGAAYLFRRMRRARILEQRLTAADGEQGDALDWAVALAGDVALVGTFVDDVAGSVDAGSAYLSTRSGTTRAERAALSARMPRPRTGLGTPWPCRSVRL